MKSLYEKRMKMLEQSNLGLNKSFRKLETRIYWIGLILVLVLVLTLIDKVF